MSQSDMETYLPMATVANLISKLIIAGDSLAELLGEPLATEDEVAEAVQKWERTRREADIARRL